MNKIISFFTLLIFSTIVQAQEKPSYSLMHDDALYFNLLPETLKTVITRYVEKGLLTSRAKGSNVTFDYNQKKERMSLLAQINFPIINSQEYVRQFYYGLWCAQNSGKKSVDILHDVRSLLPEAYKAEYVDLALQYEKNSYYTPQQRKAGLPRKNLLALVRELP